MSIYLLNHPVSLRRPHFGWDLSVPEMLLLIPEARQHLQNISNQPIAVPPLNNEAKFHVNLDVQHFSPNEISVQASGNTITVEAKHEEKEDEHGYIYRHFVRKYTIPDGYDGTQAECKLSCDGILSLMAPKLSPGDGRHRNIPIIHSGRPTLTNVQNEQLQTNELIEE